MNDFEIKTGRRNFLIGAVLGAAGLGVSGRVYAAVAKKPLPPFDLGFLSGVVTLRRRGDWTSEQPKVWMLREGGVFDRITVHHEGGALSTVRDKTAVAAEIDSVYAGHRSRNYADIAYHFIIDRGGCVWEGRSLAYEGAHVSHQNKNNLGILVLGNYEKQNPTPESLKALKAMVLSFRKRFGIKHHRVYGHRDLGASLCPGTKLYPHVAAMRNGR